MISVPQLQSEFMFEFMITQMNETYSQPYQMFEPFLIGKTVNFIWTYEVSDTFLKYTNAI